MELKAGKKILFFTKTYEMTDLFSKIADPGPLGKYAEMADGYFMFPELICKADCCPNFHFLLFKTVSAM